MDLKITVVHTADEKLLSALAALSGSSVSSNTTEKKAAPAKVKAAKQEEEPVEEPEVDDIPEDEPEEELVEEPAKAGVSLEDVSDAARKLIAAGKSANLKAILKKYGAAKVVDLDKKKYAAILKEIKAIK